MDWTLDFFFFGRDIEQIITLRASNVTERIGTSSCTQEPNTWNCRSKGVAPPAIIQSQSDSSSFRTSA